jgi:alpha-beta hydrolase superfamily lysophospholipase
MATAVAARRPDPHLGAMRTPPGRVSGLVSDLVSGLVVLVALLTGCAGVDPGQRWRPHTGEPRATVVIHHGLADHSDRHAGFAERLVHAGHAVWAFDMRGHGRSADVRVQIDRIDDLLDDLDAFLALVRDREPGRPIGLYGHGLGGLVTALYVIERDPQVAGVVRAAPGIAFDAPPIQPSAIRLIAALAPNTPVLDVPHAQSSVDRRVVAEMDGDPPAVERQPRAELPWDRPRAQSRSDGVRRPPR